MLLTLHSLVILLTIICESRQDIDVKVTIFYKPLGRDSGIFIAQQFFPTYKNFGKSLKVNLVPYQNDSFNTNGVNKNCKENDECYASAVHACIIKLYPPGQSSMFAACSMNTKINDTAETFTQCSHYAQLVWTDIEMCYKSGQYKKLFDLNGKRTAAANVTYFPTVIVNDHFDQVTQNEALFNFKRLICKFMVNEPEYCEDQE